MSMSDQLSFGAHAVGETPLPTRVVTFFFTDVEGSTRLWRRFRDSMRSALACHDVLIEDLVSKHEGFLVRPRGEGDSRFAVFPRASDAVAAACAIQIALVREPWRLPEPLRGAWPSTLVRPVCDG